jgi:hypothetical protein
MNCLPSLLGEEIEIESLEVVWRRKKKNGQKFSPPAHRLYQDSFWKWGTDMVRAIAIAINR